MITFWATVAYVAAFALAGTVLAGIAIGVASLIGRLRDHWQKVGYGYGERDGRTRGIQEGFAKGVSHATGALLSGVDEAMDEALAMVAEPAEPFWVAVASGGLRETPDGEVSPVTATLLTMPGMVTVTLPELTTAQKTARIEDMACMTGLTPEVTADLLARVAHESLRGEALMDAWLRAENAIACRDATPEDDGDWEMYDDRASDAIHDLIHGAPPARGSRNNNGGQSA